MRIEEPLGEGGQVKLAAITLLASLSVALATSCGSSSSSESTGPKLTGYGATKDDFAEGKEPDKDKADDCCFLPEQADGSDRWYAVMYDENDRVYTYGMSFVPTIVIAGAQNVILGELPSDAKLVFTVKRRTCKMMEYRSRLVRQAFRGSGGPWDILVALYSSQTTAPYNDLVITDISFSNVKAGNHSVGC
jgi:hypothetical protein